MIDQDNKVVKLNDDIQDKTAESNSSEAGTNPKPRNKGIYLLPNLFTTGACSLAFMRLLLA